MALAQGWTAFAQYYDSVYSKKDYRAEANKIHSLIRRFGRSRGKDLLDAACGTGNHIRFLQKEYHISGLDLSPHMLAIARKKYPSLQFFQKDMAAFHLKKRFDAVISLFSSIGYLKTYRRLNQAIACFTRHLKPGGILIMEPFLSKKTYDAKRLSALFVDQPDVKIARINQSKREGNIAILDFHYLIGTAQGVAYIKDRHELALFEPSRVLALMKQNSFSARFLKDGLLPGRGLYVGIKHTSL